MSRTLAGRAGMLRHGAVAFAAASVVASLAAPAATALAQGPEGQIRAVGTAQVVPDSYVVVLRDSAVAPDQVGAKAHELGSRFGGRVGHTYQAALRGFEVTLPAAAARRLAADPSVAYVQQNGVYGIEDVPTVQSPAPSYGLDRIDQRSLPLDNAFGYPGTGSNVTAYIIDTGIRFSHTEFGGRAVSGVDEIDGGTADDANGHGTHVAATVGGATYGVAKGVTLVAVRVLDATGHGSTDGVIAGVDWVTANHQANQRAVANMSLGGGTDSALDSAVERSIADGIVYGVAAGNDAANACGESPARVTNAITVGATTSTDARASFSNTGSCVDLFAPGANIKSAWFTGDTATAFLSGTSMATPHVVGAAALLLEQFFFGPLTASDSLIDAATTGVVTDAGTGSPNRLLYSNPLRALGLSFLPDQSTKVNTAFSAQVSAFGGYQPYTFSASGLPAGVTFDPATAVISGTPSVLGQFVVGYSVRDNAGQVRNATFIWNVTENEIRQFTGFATASKPTTALSLAASRAQSKATAAGFGGCEMVDSNAELNEFGTWDAFVTLSCFR